MTKKDILNKIKRTILGEDTTPGITNTKKVQKTEKQFSDEYYKETDKKFKDYLGIKKDTFDTPKVNADEKQEKSYGGSGMEGLTYDNEGTEVEKKFKKRNDDLNKPSKDYYLKKDEVNDVYAKLKTKAKDYQEDKKKFQNTKPVRAIKAESTMKRLTYKKEFLSENAALSLIPEEFKKDDLVFEMTDGNKMMRVRWEGGKNGKAVVLLSKDSGKINEELDRMHKLFEYNSRETLGKSNLLTEEKEFHNMINKFKGSDEATPTTQSTSTPASTVKKSLRPTMTGYEIEFKDGKWVFGLNVNRMKPDDFRDAVVSAINAIPGYQKGSTTSVSGQPLTLLQMKFLKPYVDKKIITQEQANAIVDLNLGSIR